MSTLHESTFDYLKPTDEQSAVMAEARGRSPSALTGSTSCCRPVPDKTYVLRQLRDCGMWANVAITRQPDGAPRA